MRVQDLLDQVEKGHKLDHELHSVRFSFALFAFLFLPFLHSIAFSLLRVFCLLLN